MKKGRIFSGSRPTGRQHLGHYKGILENWVSLQDDYECFFGVVDWHALTTNYDQTETIQEHIRETVIDWISAGIDPKKSTIFVQSEVKEHAELALLLSNIVNVGRLERNPTYKDQIQELNLGNSVPAGLLFYPVLQAADILLYKSDVVPIGEDQKPHLELTREIARRFNYLYGDVKEVIDGEEIREEIVPVPEIVLSKVPRLLGTDRRKMSKSYGNAIELGSTKEDVEQHVRSMVTDPQRVRLKDPGDPEVCTVYDYHKVFSDEETVTDFAKKCRNADIGCMKCKGYLAEMLNKFLEPMRERRRELEAQPELIDQILDEGREKATKIARATMEEVREAMNLKR